MKCGDKREGFARVRCLGCRAEFFVAFSCRQRSCCPSCDQKRAVVFGLRLAEEFLAPVPHRQWVFTLPKRFRIYFRFDRRLLGKLCCAAFETVAETLAEKSLDDPVSPGMVATVQTFGNLIHWNAHVHALVTEGGFSESGEFIPAPHLDSARCQTLWQEKVFDLLLPEEKISEEVVRDMRRWKHSGFSIDCSVRLEAVDSEGARRVAEYMARCPFSLARILSVNRDGKVIYRAMKREALPYPEIDNDLFKSGISRNFQIFDPLEFLAQVTQHIPNKGELQIRYYGWYSNKSGD